MIAFCYDLWLICSWFAEQLVKLGKARPSLRFAVRETTLSQKSKQNIDCVASVRFSLICSQKYGRLAVGY